MQLSFSATTSCSQQDYILLDTGTVVQLLLRKSDLDLFSGFEIKIWWLFWVRVFGGDVVENGSGIKSGAGISFSFQQLMLHGHYLTLLCTASISQLQGKLISLYISCHFANHFTDLLKLKR